MDLECVVPYQNGKQHVVERHTLARPITSFTDNNSFKLKIIYYRLLFPFHFNRLRSILYFISISLIDDQMRKITIEQIKRKKRRRRWLIFILFRVNKTQNEHFISQFSNNFQKLNRKQKEIHCESPKDSQCYLFFVRYANDLLLF